MNLYWIFRSLKRQQVFTVNFTVTFLDKFYKKYKVSLAISRSFYEIKCRFFYLNFDRKRNTEVKEKVFSSKSDLVDHRLPKGHFLIFLIIN